MSYKIGDKVMLGGDCTTPEFKALCTASIATLGRTGVVTRVQMYHSLQMDFEMAEIRWDRSSNGLSNGTYWVPTANLLPVGGTMTGRLVAPSTNEGLIEQALALPTADRQRLYKLLYNSGCRINR